VLVTTTLLMSKPERIRILSQTRWLVLVPPGSNLNYSIAPVLSGVVLMIRICRVVFLVALWSLSSHAGDKPNIVLVMADDQGWGDMAYNGHPVVQTPNFDQAAATGLRFDRFYAAAPVCSPTRASVLTGRHPNRMGVFKWGYPMRPQEVTVAEALKTAGYVTGHFGKWHLGSVRNGSPCHPGACGFDEWLSAENFYDNGSILSRRGTAVPTEGESSMVAVDAALEWMKKVEATDDPFLAVVWFGSPHLPHRAIEADRQLYSDQPKNMQNFLGELTGMDRAFGKLRDSLTEMGIRENTILWYCSDNGALPKVGSTGGFRGHKGKVYEGGLLVPAIIEWPAVIKQHRTTDIRCNTCDIFPTLMEVTGVKPPSHPLDGVSLVPLIKGEPFAREKPMGFWDYTAKGISTPSDKWMTELFEAQKAGRDLKPNPESLRAAEFPNPKFNGENFPGHAAMIDGDWKLHRIEKPNGKVQWELFDLKNDQQEAMDSAAEESAVMNRIKPKLQSWLKSVSNSVNGEDYDR
jgi:arylsulfatase A-like enzyme